MRDRFWLLQAWTIAKIELRRAFFSKRAFWVYGLALLPSIIFGGHSIATNFRRHNLSSHGFVRPALVESIQNGESVDDVTQRLGEPARDFQWVSYRRARAEGEASGITTHKIEPGYEARFIRLQILSPNYNNDPWAR